MKCYPFIQGITEKNNKLCGNFQEHYAEESVDYAENTLDYAAEIKLPPKARVCSQAHFKQKNKLSL